MSVIAKAIADRQSEIERLQVEIKALNEVDKIFGPAVSGMPSLPRPQIINDKPPQSTAGPTEDATAAYFAEPHDQGSCVEHLDNRDHRVLPGTAHRYRRTAAVIPRCRGRSAWRTRRPPPAGATTPAIASRSLLFDQIPSVFEQVASAALVTSSPGRGARQLPGDARVSRSCRLNFQARGV